MTLNDEEARNKLLGELMNDALTGPSTRVAQAVDPSKLAHRELPPGTWSQMYLLYQAFCLANDLECASRASFYSSSKPWRKALKFRAQSKHSLCFVCDRIKSRMRHSTDFLDHARAADDLLGHLRTTWQCRQSYWCAREQSRAHQDVLCLIFDGYDKAKPVFPRWPHGRQPKNPVFERVNRTHVSVSCILAHGYGAFVFLSEESNTAGGTFSWECLLYAINACRLEDRQRGRCHAGTLWCQHDNTVKELKNQLSGILMSSLVQDGYYEEAGAHMLPVGHTHEDVGFSHDKNHEDFWCFFVSLLGTKHFVSHSITVANWDAVFGYITTHLLNAGEKLQTVHDFQRLAGQKTRKLSKLTDWKLFEINNLVQAARTAGGAGLSQSRWIFQGCHDGSRGSEQVQRCHLLDWIFHKTTNCLQMIQGSAVNVQMFIL